MRSLIDRVDAGVIALAALRRRLVRIAAPLKPSGATRDPARELRVHGHAVGVANDLGLPMATGHALMDVLIRDACELQGLSAAVPDRHAESGTAACLGSDPDQGPAIPPQAMMPAIMNTSAFDTRRRGWLRLIPPPARLAPLLRWLPRAPQNRLLQSLATRALAQPLAKGEFDFLNGRRVGIEVTDLGLCFVFTLVAAELRVVDLPAEASVRGTLVDLLMLASRSEDADTLFFQRRLELTGDTELGLEARNTLDRLDWEQVPLALRIPLHRAAAFAHGAREAHRGQG